VHACARRAWALARTRRPVFPDRRAAEAGAVQIKQKRFSAPPDRFWPGAACHPWILPACSAAAFASAFTKKKGVAYSLAGCYFFPLALLPDQTATSLSSPSVALLHCIYISRGLNSPLFSVKHLAQPLPGPWNPEALPVFRHPRTHDDSCSRPAQTGSQPNPK
jgi:hypothetical protein